MGNLNPHATHAFTGELKVYDFEVLSITTAAGLSAAKLAAAGKQKAVRVWISVEGADMRYRLDGAAPAADTGHLIENGGALEVEGITNLERLKMIAVSGTALVSVSYSRYED